MIVVDASVVIAFLDPGDPHHDRASALFEAHIAGGFRLHEVTLAEVLVGAVRTGRGAQRLDDLIALGVTVHESEAGEPLVIAEMRASTGLKLPDCCVLVAARALSLPVATFDGQLAAAARGLGLRAIP